MSILDKALKAAAGNAGGDKANVEDVFSTYLYHGNQSSGVTVNNGVDLAGEGGMVWFKRRNAISEHGLFDSERNNFYRKLESNTTDQSANYGSHVTPTSTGFTLDTTGYGETNNEDGEYVSWTFRKAERFFDVVTYTGNGGTAQSISHNLGVTPGMIIVKRTDSAFKWFVYHRSTGASKYLQLNDTAAAVSYGGYWDSTSPTDTAFTIGTDVNGNASGGTYVAYVFAHDPDGEDDDGMIACGSYSPTNSDPLTVSLGWEPQFVMIKKSTGSSDWVMIDSTRGMAIDSWQSLNANLSQAEESKGYESIKLNADGFDVVWGNNAIHGGTATHIYMAIRAPMMKEPEAGTEVFAIDTVKDHSTTSSGFSLYAGFPVDMAMKRVVNTGIDTELATRLTKERLLTNTTGAAWTEFSGDSNTSWYHNASTDNNHYSWMFKRAKGYFDVVAYTGNSNSTITVNHSLGVAPEMVWVKRRNGGANWFVGQTMVMPYGITASGLNLNLADELGQYFFMSTPTSTEMELHANINSNTTTYIAYLFATLDGVSKVGSYTGTGNALNIDCGFSNGARFVLIKRTDGVGDWGLFDTARGIVSGNDSKLVLNDTAAEVTGTDHIDPYSSGFTLSGNIEFGGSGREYIFLAIA